MTDAQRIYRSIVDFIDQQTEGLPPEIGLKMVRSYASILSEPEPCICEVAGYIPEVDCHAAHGAAA